MILTGKCFLFSNSDLDIYPTDLKSNPKSGILPSDNCPFIKSKTELTVPFLIPRTVTQFVENVLLGNTHGYVFVIRSGTLTFRGITNQLFKCTETSKADYFRAA